MDLALPLASDGLTADLSIVKGTPLIDDGLQTAVYISLFSDARVAGDGGWWGDLLGDSPLGSRLWTLARAKLVPGIETIVEGYCREALAWLVDGGIAESVTPTVTIVRPSTLSIEVEITQPGDAEASEYRFTWSALSGDSIQRTAEESKTAVTRAEEFDGDIVFDGYMTYGRIDNVL